MDIAFKFLNWGGDFIPWAKAQHPWVQKAWFFWYAKTFFFLNWFSPKYYKDVRFFCRRCEIAWAYDGACNAGRDQEWWIKESNENLKTFMLGHIPTRIVLQTYEDCGHEYELPWKMRARLRSMLLYCDLWLLARRIRTANPIYHIAVSNYLLLLFLMLIGI